MKKEEVLRQKEKLKSEMNTLYPDILSEKRQTTGINVIMEAICQY